MRPTDVELVKQRNPIEKVVASCEDHDLRLATGDQKANSDPGCSQR